MNTDKNNSKILPDNPGNPFKVPEDYFQNLHENVLLRIKDEDAFASKQVGRKIHLRPYLSLAASISGLALIIYLVLQTIVGNNLENSEYYDLAILEEAGIISDEYIIAESYNLEATSYDEWEEDAMNYLASNEVDLLLLLDSN